MPVWIIAAATATIVITGLLTFALWRMNAPALEQARKDAAQNSNEGGGDGDGGE